MDDALRALLEQEILTHMEVFQASQTGPEIRSLTQTLEKICGLVPFEGIADSDGIYARRGMPMVAPWPHQGRRTGAVP